MDLKMYCAVPVPVLTGEQKERAENFIHSRESVVLATQSPSGPRISNLQNLGGQTVTELWYATDSRSRKIMNIKSDPRCELMFTDGRNQLYLTGRATVVDDTITKTARWEPWMEGFFPGGPIGGDFCLLKITPESARLLFF